MFVLCYLSGKDIAQSSGVVLFTGRALPWDEHWCIAHGERRVQCGLLAPPARTQGPGGVSVVGWAGVYVLCVAGID